MAKLCCLALTAIEHDGLVTPLTVSKCVCVAAAYSQKRLNALPQLDGLTATMMDEALLMREPLLRHYWSSVARFSQAHCEDLIKGNIDAVQVSHHRHQCSLSMLTTRLQLNHHCNVVNTCIVSKL